MIIICRIRSVVNKLDDFIVKTSAAQELDKFTCIVRLQLKKKRNLITRHFQWIMSKLKTYIENRKFIRLKLTRAYIKNNMLKRRLRFSCKIYVTRRIALPTIKLIFKLVMTIRTPSPLPVKYVVNRLNVFRSILLI